MAQQVAHDRWTQPDPHTAARWITDQERMDRGLAPFGRRMLELAALAPGERVLDVGCGTGATTLAAWKRVAPTGSVTGVDTSPRMLVAARDRLRAVSDARIAWLQADAETYVFTRSMADVAISRFGVAHFLDTAAAFGKLHQALRPDGRVVFVEWAARAENEWMSLANDVARFARLREGRMLKTLDSSARQAYLNALERELQQRTRNDGVHLGGTAWIVDARARVR